MSSIAKFDVEKFDGSNDFGLWRMKMQCLLIQHGLLRLCLDNKVLREVNKEDSDRKKLVNTFQHQGSIVTYLSLPSSYDNFVETLIYRRESLTLEDVLSSLNSRELKKRTNAKDDGDGLYVRGRSDHWGSPEERLSIWNKKKSNWLYHRRMRDIEWIKDSGGSFHMTPMRDFLLDFKEFNGGTVLLGDNKACAIMGTEKVRVQMKDGTLDREGYTVKLQNGKAKAKSGEASVGIQEKESLAQVWHKRLGHISKACLHELERRDVLGNKGLGKLEFCENCVLGKLTKGVIEDVVFNESLMYKDTLKGAGVVDSGKGVEFETHQWSKVDDMAAYAFAIAEEEDTHKPITFQEAINSSQKDEWVRVMEEEMSSLKKNHT
ncbi:retrovirus-related pol polyprotein from transposon TNT 1-94 [Tanacetum coccineum]